MEYVVRMYEFSCTYIYLCIRTCIFAEQSLYKGTFAVGVSFFGQRVKVLFDDKKEYMGVIAMW